MKIQLVSLLAMLLLTPACIHAETTQPNCPTATGAYLLDGTDWKSVDPIHSVGWKTTNLMGSAMSYGVAKAKVKAQFRDAQSPYQLGGNTLTICLVGVADSARDIAIAKLQEEKNRRELEMGSWREWTGVSAQIDPRVLVPISIEKQSDKVYLITSKAPLPRGEFILFAIVPDLASMAKANTPTSLGGYDFGVHAK